ncbi:MAG: cation:proton antiporter [Bryobacterales bacterium]|nr:cation:proton antiporter [Bryobacterales bacterium]
MLRIFGLFLIGLLVALPALAAEAAGGGHGEHGLIVVEFLLCLVVVILGAKLGGEVFERLNQPAVLGELLVGIVLGNLTLLGIGILEPLKSSDALAIAAEIGVIILLFEVGLESHLRELLAVGMSALLVAMLGVVAPMILGYGASSLLMPELPWYVHTFVGATLSATSVGITARVLKDLRRMDTKEARIILGAAVVDDVLGLIILAVVSGVIASIAATGSASVNFGDAGIIIAKAVLFLAAAVVLGQFIHLKMLGLGKRFKVAGVPLAIALSNCFLWAGLAGLIGLAPIVGAFAAGLVLEESDYHDFTLRGEESIEKLLRPISSIVVPVFFVVMGLKVDLSVFASLNVLALAGAITLVAIIGKQVCSLGVLEKGLNRVVVGIGMIPRGEVGLIFTGIGAGLAVNGEPVLGAQLVSAMVVMVMVTTLVTPPLLKAFFAKE